MSTLKGFEAAAKWWADLLNDGFHEKPTLVQRVVFERVLIKQLYRHVHLFSPYPAWIIIELTPPRILRDAAAAARIEIVDGFTFPFRVRMVLSSDGSVRVARDNDPLTDLVVKETANAT